MRAFDPAKYISELQHAVDAAAINYEVWWVYKGNDTRPRFTPAMNRYSTFFLVSIHAHFVAMLMALYRLHEKREDTYNVPSLLRYLRENRTIDEATLDQLDAIYGRAKPLWIKVSTLRNEVFGHRSLDQTMDESFKKADMCADDLKDLLGRTEEILSIASRAGGRGAYRARGEAREDLIRLLSDISLPQDHS